MPPLWSLRLGVFLHRCHPYGIQEGFEVFKVSASYPVRLGNRTYRTWGLQGLFFLKLTSMVALIDAQANSLCYKGFPANQ